LDEAALAFPQTQPFFGVAIKPPFLSEIPKRFLLHDFGAENPPCFGNRDRLGDDWPAGLKGDISNQRILTHQPFCQPFAMFAYRTRVVSERQSVLQTTSRRFQQEARGLLLEKKR